MLSEVSFCCILNSQKSGHSTPNFGKHLPHSEQSEAWSFYAECRQAAAAEAAAS